MKSLIAMALSVAMLATPAFANDAQKAKKPKEKHVTLPAATYDSVAYGKHKMPPAPKPDVVEKDPTHSGVFIERFKDAAVKHGVSCRRGTMEDFLKELAK